MYVIQLGGNLKIMFQEGQTYEQLSEAIFNYGKRTSVITKFLKEIESLKERGKLEESLYQKCISTFFLFITQDIGLTILCDLDKEVAFDSTLYGCINAFEGRYLPFQRICLKNFIPLWIKKETACHMKLHFDNLL